MRPPPRANMPDMAAGPRPVPSTLIEEAIWLAGRHNVAGVDEVGRGPLAGPLFSAAVILAQDRKPEWLSEVRDSKVLHAADRERLATAIKQEALAYAIGWSSVAEIDGWGIASANRTAMMRALNALPVSPEFILVDGPATLPGYPSPQRAVVGGDATCSSIAAASIVAKVARDHLMRDLDAVYPVYGFGANKGYGTPAHLEQLRRHGPSDQHRQSWLAVQKYASGGEFRNREIASASR